MARPHISQFPWVGITYSVPPVERNYLPSVFRRAKLPPSVFRWAKLPPSVFCRAKLPTRCIQHGEITHLVHFVGRNYLVHSLGRIYLHDIFFRAKLRTWCYERSCANETTLSWCESYECMEQMYINMLSLNNLKEKIILIIPIHSEIQNAFFSFARFITTAARYTYNKNLQLTSMATYIGH